MDASVPDWIQAGSSLLAVVAAGAAVYMTFFVFKREREAETSREAAELADRLAREQAMVDARLAAARCILERSHEAVKKADNKLNRRGKVYFSLNNIDATEDDIAESHSLLQSLDVMALPSADLVQRVIDARYWVLTAKRRTARLRRLLEEGREPVALDAYEVPLNKLKHLSRVGS